MPKLGSLAALALVSCLASASLIAKDEFDALDDRIVQAYNADPKRTAEVYALCLDMFDLCAGKKGERADAWLEKSRKLLTLACLSEALAAQKKGDWKQVYVWCGRASAGGASQGEMGGFDLAEASSLLASLQTDAKRAMDASGESYGSLSLEFRRPSRADARALQGSEPPDGSSSGSNVAPASVVAGPFIDVQGGGLQKGPLGSQERLRGGTNGGISVIDGPRQDRERNLFIRIKTPAGRDVEIVFHKDKGWTDKSKPSPIYFDTWMKCAEDCVRNESR